jgi:hypothetical protein
MAGLCIDRFSIFGSTAVEGNQKKCIRSDGSDHWQIDNSLAQEVSRVSTVLQLCPWPDFAIMIICEVIVVINRCQSSITDEIIWQGS